MDSLLITIVLLGLPSLVAHILTLMLLWDCRKHGSTFGLEAKYAQSEMGEYLTELVKIGSDVADTLENAFDNAAVTTVAGSEPTLDLMNLDPKEMLMRTISSVILDKLNPQQYGSTKSEEWQVPNEETFSKENDLDGTETQTEELQSD